MLRNLLIVGVIAGSSASVPILYQANPQAFQHFVKSALSDKPKPEPKNPVVVVARQQPQATTDVLLGKKVRLTPDKSGHYRAEFRMDGRPIEAIVDTGASYVAINETTARKIGISLTPTDFKYKVETANGTTVAAAVKLDRIQIGRIDVANVQTLVLQDQALSEALVGLSFLNQLHRFGVDDGGLVLEQ